MLLAPERHTALAASPASTSAAQTAAAATPASRRSGDRALYFALLSEQGGAPGRIDDTTASASRAFLVGKLQAAMAVDEPVPTDPRALPAWLAAQHSRTAEEYRRYLDARQAGGPRRFFSNRSHALHFVRTAAPTKLVDGAWLYGTLAHWQDPRLVPLIRIYLEELGDGVPARHHVLLYRQLLARHGLEGWATLDDACFTQGAVQLALAHHAAEFLPEVIGFNLGYEQLPLHLPITAYELNELGIDPWYFTLHVTIDNASTGHARKALQCVLDCAAHSGDPAAFMRRVANGWRLNSVGMGTTEIIEGFDLTRELHALLAAKAEVGALLHSDYCKVAGRTVSDWLRTPGQIPQFLQALQDAGWIQRGQPPQHSRFFRLLTDEQAPMFGVFDAYEQQLLADWISDVAPAGHAPAQDKPHRAVNRFRQRTSHGGDAGDGTCPATALALALPLQVGASVRQVVARHLQSPAARGAAAPGPGHPDAALHALRDRLDGVDSRAEAMQALAGLLSPAQHPTPAGLVATRIVSDLLAR